MANWRIEFFSHIQKPGVLFGLGVKIVTRIFHGHKNKFCQELKSSLHEVFEPLEEFLIFVIH